MASIPAMLAIKLSVQALGQGDVDNPNVTRLLQHVSPPAA
jgi:hypothetical protein